MQAVILAAGGGKRLYPITAMRSKAMAPVLGKPIVQRVMETLVNREIDEFILVVSPHDSEIGPYFKGEHGFDTQVTLVEQPKPLGMAHALIMAMPFIHGDFILSSCDNLVPKDEISQMIKIWIKEKPEGLLTTLNVNDHEIVRMGSVALDGSRVIKIIEKPELSTALSNTASAPLYIFTPVILNYLANVQRSTRGEFEFQDAIQMLLEHDGNVHSFPISTRADLTRPIDLLNINQIYLGIQHPPIFAPDYKETNVRLIGPVHIGERSRIGKNSIIGSNVYIEGSNEIGDQVKIENAVVLRGTNIQSNSTIKNQVL